MQDDGFRTCLSGWDPGGLYDRGGKTQQRKSDVADFAFDRLKPI